MKKSDIHEKPADFNISYLIHNNLMQLFKFRPTNKETPNNFPYENLNLSDSTIESEINEKSKIGILISSSNINIILNSAALSENAFETLLLHPFGQLSKRVETINDIAIDIFKDNLSKISSLNNYFEYYHKIYKMKVKEIMLKEEILSINILFNLRHVIIHASSMRGKFIIEEKIAYSYIDDPFYMSILENIKTLMGIEESCYFIPEDVLIWNNLIDKLIINTSKGIEKVVNYSRSIFPDLQRVLQIEIEHIDFH